VGSLTAPTLRRLDRRERSARTLGPVPAPFLPPLVRELPAGVVRARLPTPFAGGAVNSYLFLDPPVTVVDPGTVTDKSLERLGAALAAGGRTIADVEQVVVTHAHPDHFGAAAWVARRAGAVIVAGRAEVSVLQGVDDGPRRAPMLTALGAPADLVERSLAGRRHNDAVQWADDVPVTGLDDGDVVHAGGHVLTAHVTAGHAPGHLSLWSADARLLVSGDHLLGRIVPLTGLEPSGVGAGHRPSLDEYLSSLPRFVGLDPAVVLPGHGEAFTAVDVLARRLEVHHTERCAAVKALVVELGRPTPFEIAQHLLWQAQGSRLLRGLADVVGHLDVLERNGEVSAVPDGVVLRYRATA
jgi:glyoxylase-like metal-dependent hydrolase (beta-lactamase superfamily II)